MEALGKRVLLRGKGKRLARAVKTLHERHQLILALYYQEKLTLKEIGLVLGVLNHGFASFIPGLSSRLRAARIPEDQG